MIKLVFRLVILGAVFVAGYQMGREPGSPDIVQIGLEKARQVDRIVRDVWQSIEGGIDRTRPAAVSHVGK
jgi:hypothetical protein